MSNRSGQRVTRDSSGRRCSCRCELASWHGGRGQGPHPHRSARVAKSPGTPKILGCMPSSTGPNPQIRIRLDRGLSRWILHAAARDGEDPARSSAIWRDLGRSGPIGSRRRGAAARTEHQRQRGVRSDPDSSPFLHEIARASSAFVIEKGRLAPGFGSSLSPFI